MHSQDVNAWYAFRNPYGQKLNPSFVLCPMVSDIHRFLFSTPIIIPFCTCFNNAKYVALVNETH
jgi:hypothetical protein